MLLHCLLADGGKDGVWKERKEEEILAPLIMQISVHIQMYEGLLLFMLTPGAKMQSSTAKAMLTFQVNVSCVWFNEPFPPLCI